MRDSNRAALGARRVVLALSAVLGRLFDGRSDGMLVRVSTPVEGDDTVSARGRLVSFATRFDSLLGQHWPIERRCESRDPNGCLPEAANDLSVSKVPGGRGAAHPRHERHATMGTTSR